MKLTYFTHSITVVALLFLTNCAAQEIRWYKSEPSWNPPEGFNYASAKCEAEADKVPEPSLLVTSTERGRSYRAYLSCMKAYGYRSEVKRIPGSTGITVHAPEDETAKQ